MNENLQNALSELANGLGVSTSQLWDWLQGYGVEAYAKVKVVQNGMSAFGFFIIFVLSVILLIHGLRREDDAGWDDIACCEVFGGGLSSILMFIFFISFFTDFICWVVSPEGMVIQQLIDKLS